MRFHAGVEKEGEFVRRFIESKGRTGRAERKLVLVVLILAVTTLMVAGARLAWSRASSVALSGEIQDSTCASTAAHVEKDCALACVRHGAKWILYVPSKDEIYQLDDQQTPANFAAQKVTVIGILNKSTMTIRVVKIRRA